VPSQFHRSALKLAGAGGLDPELHFSKVKVWIEPVGKTIRAVGFLSMPGLQELSPRDP